MTSFTKLLVRRVSFGAVLLAAACQNDSTALFDDTDSNGSGASSSAGSGSGQGAASAGGSGNGSGNAGSGANQAAAAGEPSAGGEGAEGGEAAGSGGTGASGGSAGSAPLGGGDGGGGSEPDPEPASVTISEFEDATIESCFPNRNSGGSPTLMTDAGECVLRALIAPSLDELPDGALVTEARLTLECVNPGGEVEVAYVSESWRENSVTWNNRPEKGEVVATLVCEAEGPIVIDVTAAVQAWLEQESPNGLYFSTQDSDGTDFASSEAGNEPQRPSLSVTYTVPAVSQK